MSNMLKEEAQEWAIIMEDDDEVVVEKPSLRKRIKAVIRLITKISTLNWWCLCLGRKTALPLRALMCLAGFESGVVLGIAIYIIASAYTTHDDVQRGVYFPGMLMLLLIVALWVFLLSSVKYSTHAQAHTSISTAPMICIQSPRLRSHLRPLPCRRRPSLPASLPASYCRLLRLPPTQTREHLRASRRKHLIIRHVCMPNVHDAASNAERCACV